MGRKFGGAPPNFWRGERGPHLTQSCPGPRPTSIPSAILIYAAILPQRIWAENWGGVVPLWRRGAGSPSNTMWPGPRPTCTPSFILIRQTVWPQYANVTDRQDRQTVDRQDRLCFVVVCFCLCVVIIVFSDCRIYLFSSLPARVFNKLTRYTKCHLSPSSRLATTDIGRKLGGLCPFRGGEAGSTSNTKSPGLRPTSIPSAILIHPAVWPQQTWAKNWGGAPPPFWEGGLGSHRTQSPLG